MKEAVQKHREFFRSGVTQDLDWRIHQLKILKKIRYYITMLEENVFAILKHLRDT